MIKSKLLKNAFTISLRSMYKTLILQISNRNKHLKLGFRTNITNCNFGVYNTIYDYVVMKNVLLGDFSYVANNSNIWNTKIGKYCSIGSNVKCGLGLHPSCNFVSTHPIFYSTDKQCQVTFADKKYFQEEKQIIIGNDVWIGSNVIISSGINIGDGAIIASGAVVTKNVLPFSIVGGIPAKIIRYRFNPEEIEFLLKYKWWDLAVNWLKENFLLFHDIKTLMQTTDIKDLS